MDISFTCTNCGKNLVIDNAGAGITIDCPECGKPVYVPSAAPPPKPKEPPARVEPKPSLRVPVSSPPPPAPVPDARPRNNPLVPSYSPVPKSAVHPSIEAGVHCLVILAAIEFVGFLAMRQNLIAGIAFLYASVPFIAAPLLCAVYGMCNGHVRHGLLVLAGLSLIIGLTMWALPSTMLRSAFQNAQQEQEMFQQQMQNLQKTFPFPAPHP
jgi:TM2 domain-containing membrane protein YozV/DNA-directed RNA polymerase subunit RPC12/RpoP